MAMHLQVGRASVAAARQAPACCSRAAAPALSLRRIQGSPLVGASPCPRTLRPEQRDVLAAQSGKAAMANTIKIIIQGRKLEVTDAIRTYIQDKISKATSNHSHTLKEVDVTISARGGDTGTHGKKEQKVEVTIYTLRNGVVRVEDAEGTLYAAVDLVADKIERKLMRVKERAIVKGTWPGKAGPKEDVISEDYVAAKQEFITETREWDKQLQMSKRFDELNKHFPAEVLRTKVMELDPMTVDEAIDAMEAVGHDFFVFREMESDMVQVVYKREASGYGVLIPKKRN